MEQMETIDKVDIKDYIKNLLQSSTEEEYIEELYEEDFNDVILEDIKVICFYYLENKKIVQKLTLNELLIAYDFLEKQHKDLMRIKNNFQIQYRNIPFRDVGKTLDLITLREDTTAQSESTLAEDLSIRFNSVITDVKFCLGIINLMLEEKENDNRD